MGFVEVNGAGLRYELSGSGGRTVVLIHEMGGALESWDGVVPLLAGRRRVLRYDTRGAGMSTKARSPLSIDTMVGDLAGLLDALGVSGKVAVVGIAVGGAIALAAALRLPHRVGAAVVTSPAIGIAAERRAGVLARVEAIERQGMGVTVDDSMANGYPPELRGDPARFAAFRARWLGNDSASYAAIYRMLAGLELGKEIAAISCPVLVIAGSLDRVRPPALVEPVAKSIPDARYRVIESGHYMAVQTPELLAGAVAGFLDEVDR